MTRQLASAELLDSGACLDSGLDLILACRVTSSRSIPDTPAHLLICFAWVMELCLSSSGTVSGFLYSMYYSALPTRCSPSLAMNAL